MWIYEHPTWPEFTWDAASLACLLAEVRHQQGRILGRMESLGFDLQRESSLHTLTEDVMNSWAIEGEILPPNEVRSSIARKLGIDAGGLTTSSRDVEGIVEMMLDATQQYSQPLTSERLFAWHSALFPTGRSGICRITVGGWRRPEAGPMQVVSGPMGKEKIHFEAPDAGCLKNEMKAFLQWSNQNPACDPVLKAGIAHLWFLTLHPFEDGNGRIGRAICDQFLARADQTPKRFYSLSSQLESEREDYYRQLETQQRGTLDITPWLEWFLQCLGRSIATAEVNLNRFTAKAEQWEFFHRHPLNGRQRLILERMMDDSFQGHMNTSKYAKLAKCSKDSALRDIKELVTAGIFLQNPGGGRSTSYRISTST